MSWTVHADPADLRAAATSVRRAREAVSEAARDLESRVTRVRGESWRGAAADEVLDALLQQVEQLRATEEAFGSIAARCDRCATALEAYLDVAIPNPGALDVSPEARSEVEVTRGVAGVPTGVELSHHRSLARIESLGIEGYAIDLALSANAQGVEADATLALFQYAPKERKVGGWSVRHGVTVMSVGVHGEASREGGELSVGATLVEGTLSVERDLGGHTVGVEVRAGLTARLGVSVSSRSVALRLPFLSAEFSFHRA